MLKLTIKDLINISKPKNRIYLTGIYIIWVSSGLYMYLLRFGNMSFHNHEIFLIIWMGMYFLIPANLYIYGINKIFDKNIPKQEPNELSDTNSTKFFVLIMIILLSLPFLLTQLFLTDNYGSNIYGGLFLGFLLFAWLYWAYWVKFAKNKIMYILDIILITICRVIAWIYGFVLVIWDIKDLNWQYMLAWVFLLMATNIYINSTSIYDKSNIYPNLLTRNNIFDVLFWYNGSKIICSLFVLLSAYYSYNFVGIYWYDIAFLYILLFILSIFLPKKRFFYDKIFMILSILVWVGIFCLIIYNIYEFAVSI